MKRTLQVILSTLIVLSVTPASAKDLYPGTLVIGGDLDLSFTKSDTDFGSFGGNQEIDSTNINADIVYFTSQNTGLGLMFTHLSEQENGTGVEITTTQIGPSLTINVNQHNNNSLRFSFAYLIGSTEVADPFSTIDIDNDGFLLSAEYNTYINEHVSFDVGFVFSQIDFDDSDAETTITSVTAGFSFYLTD